jgi:hypothetical protein
MALSWGAHLRPEGLSELTRLVEACSRQDQGMAFEGGRINGEGTEDGLSGLKAERDLIEAVVLRGTRDGASSSSPPQLPSTFNNPADDNLRTTRYNGGQSRSLRSAGCKCTGNCIAVRTLKRWGCS